LWIGFFVRQNVLRSEVRPSIVFEQEKPENYASRPAFPSGKHGSDICFRINWTRLLFLRLVAGSRFPVTTLRHGKISG
jgi:hypothetical protein